MAKLIRQFTHKGKIFAVYYGKDIGNLANNRTRYSYKILSLDSIPPKTTTTGFYDLLEPSQEMRRVEYARAYGDCWDQLYQAVHDHKKDGIKVWPPPRDPDDYVLQKVLKGDQT